MKYDNTFDISTYINVTNEIANNYFDKTNGEYLPQFGSIYSVYVYFANCVTYEEGDVVTINTIIGKDDDGKDTMNLAELQKLFDNEEFMKAYNDAIANSRSYALDFSHAHADAIRIVKTKCSNNNPFIFAITQLVQTFNELFTSDELIQLVDAIVNQANNFNGENIDKLVDLAEQYKNGGFSNLKFAEDKE